METVFVETIKGKSVLCLTFAQQQKGLSIGQCCTSLDRIFDKHKHTGGRIVDIAIGRGRRGGRGFGISC